MDIETAKTKFARPEESELAFVGTKVYALRNNRYYAHKHKCFMPDEAKQLEKFLKSFRGIIVGHNIFDFDYRVLRPLVSLEEVIEKTVDTLAFLHAKHLTKRGLSLNDLSWANFGRRKTLKGKNIPKLWREGKRSKVIEYNKNDCALTYALWRKMVKERSVRVRYRGFPRGRISKTTDMALPFDLRYLTGLCSFFSFPSWKERIRALNRRRERRSKEGSVGQLDGCLHTYHGFLCLNCERVVLFRPKAKRGAVVCPACGERFGQHDDPVPVFHWFYCDYCGMTLLFQSDIERKRARYRSAACPYCAKRLGEIRADVGRTVFGAKKGRLRNGAFPIYDGWPFPSTEVVAGALGKDTFYFFDRHPDSVVSYGWREVLVTRLGDEQS